MLFHVADICTLVIAQFAGIRFLTGVQPLMRCPSPGSLKFLLTVSAWILVNTEFTIMSVKMCLQIAFVFEPFITVFPGALDRSILRVSTFMILQQRRGSEPGGAY